MSDLREMGRQGFVKELEFEAQLRAEMERRNAATPALVFTTNEAGELLSVSDAWLSKLGYARGDVFGRPFHEFLTLESKQRAISEVAPEYRRTGRYDNVQYQLVKAGGGLLDALVSEVRAKDEAGRPISLGVVTDVTDLVEASRQLAEVNRRLQALTLQDELTGLADRRAFDEGLTVEYQRAWRDDYSIAVLVIEVDGLDALTQRHGQAAAEQSQKLIARAISRTIRRRGDIAARYGDGVFAIILPSAQEAGALSVAGRIQQAVLNLAIEHGGAEEEIATVSMGVAATWPATSTEVQDTLVTDAMRALAVAKAQGRNGIAAASPAEADV